MRKIKPCMLCTRLYSTYVGFIPERGKRLYTGVYTPYSGIYGMAGHFLSNKKEKMAGRLSEPGGSGRKRPYSR